MALYCGVCFRLRWYALCCLLFQPNDPKHLRLQRCHCFRSSRCRAESDSARGHTAPRPRAGPHDSSPAPVKTPARPLSCLWPSLTTSAGRETIFNSSQLKHTLQSQSSSLLASQSFHPKHKTHTPAPSHNSSASHLTCLCIEFSFPSTSASWPPPILYALKTFTQERRSLPKLLESSRINSDSEAPRWTRHHLYLSRSSIVHTHILIDFVAMKQF